MGRAWSLAHASGFQRLIVSLAHASDSKDSHPRAETGQRIVTPSPTDAYTSMSLQSTLEQGLKHHRAGDFARAEKEYQRVLRMDPAHGQALHLSGFLAQQTGDMPRAVGLLERLSRRNRRTRCFWGTWERPSKRWGGPTKRWPRSAVRFRSNRTSPTDTTTWRWSSNRWGANAEAIEAYRAALRIQPDRIEALQNLGNRLLADGKTRDARECFARIVKAEPSLAGGHALLAGALFAEGDVDGALREFDLAIRLDPRDAQHDSIAAWSV